MKDILLFHGGENIIERPDLSHSSKYNDYGIGFYCTEEEELAGEWACKRERNGFVNRYALRTAGLNELDMTAGDHDVLNWIAILLKNRVFRLDSPLSAEAREQIVKRFSPETKGVDVITGYRADDSYFQYAQAFLENTLSLGLLNKALKLGALGKQTVLVSRKGIDAMEFLESEPVSKEIYYPRFRRRDRKAGDDYKRLVDKARGFKSDIFVLDIIREEMSSDDPRIQRILRK